MRNCSTKLNTKIWQSCWFTYIILFVFLLSNVIYFDQRSFASKSFFSNIIYKASLKRPSLINHNTLTRKWIGLHSFLSGYIHKSFKLIQTRRKSLSALCLTENNKDCLVLITRYILYVRLSSRGSLTVNSWTSTKSSSRFSLLEGGFWRSAPLTR